MRALEVQILEGRGNGIPPVIIVLGRLTHLFGAFVRTTRTIGDVIVGTIGGTGGKRKARTHNGS